ncbi:MAG: class I SAM-dependent methyltransferase [Myxococcota bacterium]
MTGITPSHAWPVEAVRARYPRSPYFSLALRLKIFSLAKAPILEVIGDHGTVLDVGCGFGFVSLSIAVARPSLSVIGVDPDPRRVRVATRAAGGLANVSFVCADARSYEYPRCRAVVFFDVLHHLRIPDQDAVLRRVGEAIEPGGVLVVFEVDGDRRPGLRYWMSYLSDVVLYPLSVRCQFRSRADLAAAARRAGLALQEWVVPPGGFGAPIVYLFRKPQ